MIYQPGMDIVCTYMISFEPWLMRVLLARMIDASNAGVWRRLAHIPGSARSIVRWCYGDEAQDQQASMASG